MALTEKSMTLTFLNEKWYLLHEQSSSTYISLCYLITGFFKLKSDKYLKIAMALTFMTMALTFSMIRLFFIGF